MFENDSHQITILFGRGADFVEYLYMRRDLDLVRLAQWGIPTQQVKENHPPNFVPFLDGYSGEHGIGAGKIESLEKEAGSASVAVMSAIKRALDPKGILNPGKIFVLS